MENRLEEQPESIYKHALKHGGILGAIATILTILCYVSSISFMGSLKFVVLIFAVYIGYVIYAGIDYRKNTGGYLGYGQAFIHGFIVLAVAGVAGLLFGLLLYQVIDTELAEKITDAIVTNTEDSMRNFGAPEDSIEEQISKMREEMPQNFSPLGQVKNYFTGLIWNAVLVLITSLFVRKNEPVAM
jgi:Protein of unknown function (DUF4199)